jgi:hypothetical protein
VNDVAANAGESTWLRRGFSPLVGWSLVLTAPFAVSGPVRAMTGWPLGPCLALTLVVTAAAIVIVWRHLRRHPAGLDRRFRRIAGATELAFAVAAAFTLYNRHFWGAVVLASSGIPDAGNHVVTEDAFVRFAPDTYAGFVALYAFDDWLARITRLDHFWSLLVATYFAIAFYCTVGLAATDSALTRFGARARYVGWAAASAWTLAVAIVLLPFLHYHHAQGFFPPLFGLLPLTALWITDALCRPPWLRLACALVLFGLYRYTYGLNLPDLALALALLVGIDAFTSKSLSARIVRGVVLVALVVVAYKAWLLLRTTYFREGPFDPYDRRLVLAATWSLIAVLGAAFLVGPLRRLVAGTGVARWLRLPIVFALLSATFMTVVPPPPRGQDYYYLKSNLHPLLLLLAASIVFVGVVAAALAAHERAETRRHDTTISVVAICCMAAALFTLHRGFAIYWPSFLQRAFGAPPFALLKPLADRRAWRRIDRVLEQHRARFGGYLTSYYPTFNFMNAAFGYWNEGIRFYWGGRQPRVERGYCVFWEGGPAASRLEASFPLEPLTIRLQQDPQHECASYPASWNPQVTRTICWLCP